jgi:hypothetical protein
MASSFLALPPPRPAAVEQPQHESMQGEIQGQTDRPRMLVRIYTTTNDTNDTYSPSNAFNFEKL